MKRLCILLFLLLFFKTAQSQFVTNQSISYENFFLLSLDINRPVSNTNLVNGTSARGVKVGFRQLLNDHFLAGVDFNSSSYNGYQPRQTYATSTGAFTSDFYNYAYVYGLTLAGDYLFAPDKKFQPYVGFGMGASYINYTIYYNVFSDEQKKWGVLLRPEAGVLLRFGKYSSWGVQGGLHFDFSTARSKDYGYNNFSNVGAQIGLVFFNW
jgi:opacity protein-like surface antigen